MSWRERLRAHIPTREQLHANRWLSWLGPRLLHPGLWRWTRKGVALGVALGVFFGLLIPIAQIPLSVGAAVVLRANVPAAAVSTLVTNPLTFGPIYYAAYRLGAWVTGDRSLPKVVATGGMKKIDPDTRLWQRVTALGKPLLVGLAITATLFALLTYGIITVIWRVWTLLKRRAKERP